MNNEVLKQLESALQLSPENIPLKEMYGDHLTKARKWEKAEKVYTELLKTNPANMDYKYSLAKIFYEKGETGKAVVMIEEFAGLPNPRKDMASLYTRLLIKEGSLEQASHYFQQLIRNNSSFDDPEIEELLEPYLGNDNSQEEEEEEKIKITYDEFEDEQIILPMEKPDMDFNDVGGMNNIKEEISMRIIAPYKHEDLFKAYGKKAGGGVLLYGPPGCGKTYVAKAAAGEIRSSFINVRLVDVLNMYIGESEKQLSYIFDYARNNTPTILFFDDVDALGASREDIKSHAGRNMITQFLSELDGLESDNEGVLILAATNAPWNLDNAFLRPGRFDKVLLAPPPDKKTREKIFRILLKNKPLGEVDYPALAEKTAHFSGSDLKALVDRCTDEKMKTAIKNQREEPIETKDLLEILKEMQPSTGKWFKKAEQFLGKTGIPGPFEELKNYIVP